MPAPRFDYDVISLPAMPPPPVPHPPSQPAPMAKAADPRHNDARGEPR